MKRLKLLVGIAISIFFLYLALRGTSWSQVGHTLEHAQYIFIIPGIGLHFIAFYIRAIKWSVISSKFKQVKSNALFPLIAIGLTMNNILPLRVGEIGRIFLLSNKFGLTKIQAGITIVIERLFDIVGLLLVVLIFIRFRTWPASVSTLLNIATVSIILFILLIPLIINLTSRFIHVIKVEKVQELFSEMKDGYFIFNDKIIILKVTLLSVLLWLFEGLSYYTISHVFSLNVSLPDMLCVCAVVNISSALPSTAGFIGTFEFFATSLLVFLGLSKSLALSFVLVLHLELLLPISIVGLYLYFTKGYYTYMTLHTIQEIEGV